MPNLPAPLTPPGCDLSGHDWFPLHFERLRKSRWWRRATDMSRARNVMLWGEAYKSVPAASLSNDDDELAEAAGFGFDIDAWMAAKDDILSPWTLCSDGRWYHPTVAELALDAWQKLSIKRRAERERKAAQRAGVRSGTSGTPLAAADVPPDDEIVPRDTDAVPQDTPENGAGHSTQERTGEETKKEERVAPRKRGCRLPSDWCPSPALVRYGIAQGLPEAKVISAAERFRLHWHSSSSRNAVKLDWDMAFQGWLRDDAERLPSKTARPRNLGPKVF